MPPNSLYDWLDKIEERPGTYLLPPDFSNLCSFIFGFDAALVSYPASENLEPPCYKFSLFVAGRLGVNPNADIDFGNTPWRVVDFRGPSWQQLIQSRSVDGQEAFAMFFRLLRDFRAGVC